MRHNQSVLTLLLLLLTGALIGGVLGEALSVFAPILTKGFTLGLNPPAQIDLWVLGIVLGFTLKINLAAAVGMLLAALLYRRL